MENLYIFKRKENKYLVSPKQQKDLMALIAAHFKEDEHGESTICNIYLDTQTNRLVRQSIEASEDGLAYKEKIRVRAYGVPGYDDTVFIELKKKFKGIVYKRRISTTRAKMERYLSDGTFPEESQIMREIDYSMKRYGWLKPSCMVFYDRNSYFCKEDPNLRITFDRNARYRTDDLSYDYGSGGHLLFTDDTRILEIKASGSYPMWLVKALDEMGIRKQSYSKIAEAFKKEHMKTFRESVMSA